MSIDDRPTVSAPDDDPYLWLEEIDGERALAFVADQSQRTLDRFGDAAFGRDRDTLTAILDRPDDIPYVTRHGDRLTNLWKDARNPRGLWRQTTLEEFRKPAAQWEGLDRRIRRSRQDGGLGLAADLFRLSSGKAGPGLSADPDRASPPRDDRVHPGHARKMTAKLQAMGYEGYLYETAAGGHGSGKDNVERAAFLTHGYSFLARQIGWNQAEV